MATDLLWVKAGSGDIMGKVGEEREVPLSDWDSARMICSGALNSYIFSYVFSLHCLKLSQIIGPSNSIQSILNNTNISYSFLPSAA